MCVSRACRIPRSRAALPRRGVWFLRKRGAAIGALLVRLAARARARMVARGRSAAHLVHGLPENGRAARGTNHLAWLSLVEWEEEGFEPSMAVRPIRVFRDDRGFLRLERPF